MSKFYKSSDIIESAKNRAAIPSHQNTFTDADFLRFANEEMSIGMVPSVLRTREDYFMVTDSVDMDGSTSYEIPYRAIGNKLRDVSYKSSSSNIIEMTRIPIDFISDYSSNSYGNSSYSYYVQNNRIHMLQNANNLSTGTLQFTYYMRPNELVSDSEASKVLNIDTLTGIITVDNVPTSFVLQDSDGIGKEYDIISERSPHRNIAYDISATEINSAAKTITFNVTDLPSDLRKGDYINLAGESIIPQIPSDLHVVLAHRVAMRCLEALGDAQGLQLGNQKLSEMESNTHDIIDDRVEASPQKVVNRHSILRNGMSRKRYRYRG